MTAACIAVCYIVFCVVLCRALGFATRHDLEDDHGQV